jgi:hypothetical protein
MQAHTTAAIRLIAIIPLLLAQALAFIPLHELGHCALHDEWPCTMTVQAPFTGTFDNDNDAGKASAGHAEDHLILFPVGGAVFAGSCLALLAWALRPLGPLPWRDVKSALAWASVVAAIGGVALMVAWWP